MFFFLRDSSCSFASNDGGKYVASLFDSHAEQPLIPSDSWRVHLGHARALLHLYPLSHLPFFQSIASCNACIASYSCILLQSRIAHSRSTPPHIFCIGVVRHCAVPFWCPLRRRGRQGQLLLSPFGLGSGYSGSCSASLPVPVDRPS